MNSINKTKNGQYLVTIPVELVHAIGIRDKETIVWKVKNIKEIIMLRK